MTDLTVTQQTASIELPQLELEIKFYLGQTAQNIIEVGKRLIQAKSLVQHGQWLNWLKNNFGLTVRTADRFIQCSERYANWTSMSNLNSTQMIQLLALPDAEETEKFIAQKAAEGKKVDEMTIRELRKEIADYKKTIEQKDKAHQQCLFELDAKISNLEDAHEKQLTQMKANFTEQITKTKNDCAAQITKVQTDCAEQISKMQTELDERPTIEPADYQSTKDALVDTRVALREAELDAKRKDNEQAKLQDKYDNIKKENKKLKEIVDAQKEIMAQIADNPEKPILFVDNGIGFTPNEPYKLLLTDPPYSTDVDDIAAFAESWLPNALSHVRKDGFAYVFIGAYPEELNAYLNISPPNHLSLIQILVWTYRNTLGNNPNDRYKQNWQACLFYRGVDAPNLDCPITNEQWAVQDINAPDGRIGNRYHKWQKPDEIAERFIRHSTQKGDTVFDPFACTGTFLLAAAKLGRNAFGFEINPDNAAIAFERGCLHGGHI